MNKKLCLYSQANDRDVISSERKLLKTSSIKKPLWAMLIEVDIRNLSVTMRGFLNDILEQNSSIRLAKKDYDHIVKTLFQLLCSDGGVEMIIARLEQWQFNLGDTIKMGDADISILEILARQRITNLLDAMICSSKFNWDQRYIIQGNKNYFPEGLTPLMYFSALAYKEGVELLLTKAKVRVDTTTPAKDKPDKNPDAELAEKYLLAKGIPMQKTENGYNALSFAFVNFDIVKILIKAGCLLPWCTIVGCIPNVGMVEKFGTNNAIYTLTLLVQYIGEEVALQRRLDLLDSFKDNKTEKKKLAEAKKLIQEEQSRIVDQEKVEVEPKPKKKSKAKPKEKEIEYKLDDLLLLYASSPSEELANKISALLGADEESGLLLILNLPKEVVLNKDVNEVVLEIFRNPKLVHQFFQCKKDFVKRQQDIIKQSMEKPIDLGCWKFGSRVIKPDDKDVFEVSSTTKNKMFAYVDKKLPIDPGVDLSKLRVMPRDSEGKNGIKILHKLGAIELKLPGDERPVTNKIIMHPKIGMLLYFDEVTDHAGLSGWAN